MPEEPQLSFPNHSYQFSFCASNLYHILVSSPSSRHLIFQCIINFQYFNPCMQSKISINPILFDFRSTRKKAIEFLDIQCKFVSSLGMSSVKDFHTMGCIVSSLIFDSLIT